MAVWAAGTVGALWAAHNASTARPGGLKELLEQGREGDEDGATNAAAELRELLQKLHSYGESIRDVVRYLQEHATLVAWLIDNFDNTAIEVEKSIATFRTSSGKVGERGAEVLEGSRTGQEFVARIGEGAERLSSDAESLSSSAKLPPLEANDGD